MALKSVIPIRLSETLDSRLDAVAAATGLSKSELIRRATDEFLSRVESSGKVTYELNDSVVAYGSTITGNPRNTFTSAAGARSVRKQKARK